MVLEKRGVVGVGLVSLVERTALSAFSLDVQPQIQEREAGMEND